MKSTVVLVNLLLMFADYLVDLVKVVSVDSFLDGLFLEEMGERG